MKIQVTFDTADGTRRTIIVHADSDADVMIKYALSRAGFDDVVIIKKSVRP